MGSEEKQQVSEKISMPIENSLSIDYFQNHDEYRGKLISFCDDMLVSNFTDSDYQTNNSTRNLDIIPLELASKTNDLVDTKNLNLSNRYYHKAPNKPTGINRHDYLVFLDAYDLSIENFACESFCSDGDVSSSDFSIINSLEKCIESEDICDEDKSNIFTEQKIDLDEPNNQTKKIPYIQHKKKDRIGMKLLTNKKGLGNKNKNNRSYSIFVKHFSLGKNKDGELDASGVFSDECFNEWLSTRRCPVKNCNESFRRALLSHLTGQCGRKPFSPLMEKAVLKLVKQNEVWKCFAGKRDRNGKPINVGAYGFRGMGYWESVMRTSVN